MKDKYTVKSTIMDEAAFRRVIKRISHEIIENNQGVEDVYLVGIRTRGVPLAEYIRDYIEEFEGKKLKFGILDITLYRDDLSIINEHPVINSTDLPFNITGSTIVLVDDVLFTGRTVRAAIEAIMEEGRPNKIQLATLIDRGHRELPIRADYVGKNVPTSNTEIVSVKVKSVDGEDLVLIMDRKWGSYEFIK